MNKLRYDVKVEEGGKNNVKEMQRSGEKYEKKCHVKVEDKKIDER